MESPIQTHQKQNYLDRIRNSRFARPVIGAMGALMILGACNPAAPESTEPAEAVVVSIDETDAHSHDAPIQGMLASTESSNLDQEAVKASNEQDVTPEGMTFACLSRNEDGTPLITWIPDPENQQDSTSTPGGEIITALSDNNEISASELITSFIDTSDLVTNSEQSYTFREYNGRETWDPDAPQSDPRRYSPNVEQTQRLLGLTETVVNEFNSYPDGLLDFFGLEGVDIVITNDQNEDGKSATGVFNPGDHRIRLLIYEANSAEVGKDIDSLIAQEIAHRIHEAMCERFEEFDIDYVGIDAMRAASESGTIDPSLYRPGENRLLPGQYIADFLVHGNNQDHLEEEMFSVILAGLLVDKALLIETVALHPDSPNAENVRRTIAGIDTIVGGFSDYIYGELPHAFQD